MAKEADKKSKKVKQPTAQKRDIQNEKKRLRNKASRAAVKTAVRKFEISLAASDAAASKVNLNEVYSALDKAAKKGFFTKNKANRSKARLTARLNAQPKSA
jgi:small subunit ribosomal protein S20